MNTTPYNHKNNDPLPGEFYAEWSLRIRRPESERWVPERIAALNKAVELENTLLSLNRKYDLPATAKSCLEVGAEIKAAVSRLAAEYSIMDQKSIEAGLVMVMQTARVVDSRLGAEPSKN